MESRIPIRPRKGLHRRGVSMRLLVHAAETFGSEQAAQKWLMSECGALNKRTPLQSIEDAGDDPKVERVLDCIDHGMIA